jgi:hypothetical protein
VIARLRVVLVLCLAVIAYAAIRPAAADAHILLGGTEFVFLRDAVIPADQTVDGDLVVILGDAHIAGHVRGDVDTFFGRCVLLDGAVIDGEAHCVTDGVPRWIAPWVVNAAPFEGFADQDKHILIKFAASMAVLFVFLLFPVRMKHALSRVERHPGLAALVGGAAAIAMLPVAVLLLVTIVGIPLIFLEAVAVIIGIWLGTGAIALLVGRRLSELVMPRTTPSPLWALILGLVVVSAAESVPYVGWAVTGLVWLVGLGASILAFFGSASLAAFRGTGIGGPPMPTRQI